jgi:Tfp pilus assembly protein PilF
MQPGNAKSERSKRRNANCLATPQAGELKSASAKADELYRRALSLDNPTPLAHRGCGMLYEKLGRKPDALTEYRKYLSWRPQPLTAREFKAY